MGVVKCLKGLGYKVYWNTLSARDFSVPQIRKRFIMIAICHDSLRHTFTWPPVQTLVNADKIIEPFNNNIDKTCRLPSGPEISKLLVNRTCSEVFRTGVDPRKVPVLIDIDYSPKYAAHGVNIARTITRTRGGQGGPWVSNRGRRPTPNKLLRLHGV